MFTWHWVFFGLVPFVVIAVVLIVPAVRRLGPPMPEATGSGRRAGVVLAALGAAVGVSALSWAAQQISPVAGVVAVVALGLLVPALRRLLPPGVVRARRGVPTVVAARGLLAGSFFTIASYLPLMLHETHGWSLTAAGVPLIAGSLCWSLASAWQGRHPDLARPTLLRVGFAGLAAGCLGLVFVAPSWGLPWLAVPLTMLCGAGMGLGFSSVSYLVLSQSTAGEVGFNTSAAQITDQLMVATMVGARRCPAGAARQPGRGAAGAAAGAHPAAGDRGADRASLPGQRLTIRYGRGRLPRNRMSGERKWRRRGEDTNLGRACFFCAQN